MTGRVFNYLTVIRLMPDLHKSGRAMWECRCSCGNSAVIAGSSLRRGVSTSCGCRTTARARIKNSKQPYEWLYNTLKGRCRRLNRECGLSFEQFVKFTGIEYCHYCERSVVWSEHKSPSRGYSAGCNLDRKDSAIGYTQDNCVVCCAVCNWVKSDEFSYEEMVELGKTIKAIREKRKP